MTTENDAMAGMAGMGHNSPPVSLDDVPILLHEYGLVALAEALPSYSEAEYASLRAKIVRVSENAAKWLDLGEIKDQETSALAADQIAQLSALKNEVGAAQKDAKKLWTAKGDEAFAAFTKLILSSQKGIDKMRDMQTKYLSRVKREKEEAAAAEQERIRLEQEKLEQERARAEASNDLMALAEADEREKELKKDEKAADRAVKSASKVSVKSATGAGRGTSLREVKVPTITNYTLTRMHYGDHPKVREVIEQIVAAEVRAATFDPKVNSIPGVTVKIEEKAI